MIKKIKVSILGATGMVGQNYLRLLENHPWFEVVDLAASPRSAGKKYEKAVAGKWTMPGEVPVSVKELILRDVRNLKAIPKGVSCVFSALDLEKKVDTRALEFAYAHAGFPLISNSSANRWTDDVPLIIPEINPHHTDVIPIQQERRGLPKSGFVAVKPNCSVQSYLVTLLALERAGFPVDRVQVTTLQALSGAGQAGINSEIMQENVIPYIQGEEEKTEEEPLKIFGTVGRTGILSSDRISISATCTRVPAIDGHTAVVHVDFKNNVPDLDAIKNIWRNFKAEPQALGLPFAPENPIIYLEDQNRPQPKLDRDRGKGMTVSTGRLRKDKFFNIRYVALSHNTVRGAAGGAILMAELLVEKEYIGGEKFT